jgi:hypothetical protein
MDGINNINNYYFNKIKYNLKKINKHINILNNNTKNILTERCNFNICTNINYVSSMINSIQNEMSKIIIKKNNDEEIDDNINQLSFLFTHLNKIIKVYNIEEENFELVNIRLKNENFEHFIPEKDKVIETFDFSFLTKLFNQIKKPLENITSFLVKFSKWFGTVFLNMVKMFIKILEFFVKFLTVILPKLLKALYVFLTQVAIKFMKVGIITILFGTVLFITLSKYWKYILGENSEQDIPIVLTTLPAVLVTWSIFWKKTYVFEYFQIQLIKKTIQLLRGSLKIIFIHILGLPEDHKFFTTNSKSFLDLTGYLLDLIYKNFDTIVLRLLITLAIIKIVMVKYIDIIRSVTPSVKEFFLYFNILIHRMVQSIKK